MQLKPFNLRTNPSLRSAVNLSLELIPVGLFLLGSLWNIYVSTGLLMVGSIASIIIYVIINRKAPISTIALAILALVFGALTIALKNPDIIKIKVTVLNLLIAIAFFAAAFWRKNILSIFTPKFARKPSWFVIINNAWGIFFVVMAVLNEIVWRHTSDKIWIYFKVFGISGLVIIFGLLQSTAILAYVLHKKQRVFYKNRLLTEYDVDIHNHHKRLPHYSEYHSHHEPKSFRSHQHVTSERSESHTKEKEQDKSTSQPSPKS